MLNIPHYYQELQACVGMLMPLGVSCIQRIRDVFSSSLYRRSELRESKWAVPESFIFNDLRVPAGKVATSARGCMEVIQNIEIILEDLKLRWQSQVRHVIKNRIIN